MLPVCFERRVFRRAYANSTITPQVAGDFWAVGHNAYGPGDRNFGIGCHVQGLCLSTSPTGIVEIQGSLRVKATRQAYAPSCPAQSLEAPAECAGPAGRTLPSAQGGGRASTQVTWGTVAHPDGDQYVPQYCLLNAFGTICGGTRTSTSMEIRTASDGVGTIADRDF